MVESGAGYADRRGMAESGAGYAAAEAQKAS